MPTASAKQQANTCRRCGAALHSRHTNSLNRTWALLISAIIFYIPANLLPITLTTAVGKTEGDTIMQGVIYFLFSGDWPVALVIFTASIMVPMLKMAALTYLLISVQRHSSHRPLDRAKIYRMVEFVGRWSMIDVFVVTIMVALVQLGALASIQAGSGAIFFCGVVIITMLAAASFDPRLIWDECGDND
ncbi:MAG: paraquat-inducible membrane protein A [Gammaproteobacteria bacterium]|nr:MAG: paraquat-inducible membrane protein A [Gammaproteobacteria bacterium]